MNIKKKLIIQLTIAWVILSILTSGLVLTIEIRKQKKFVLDQTIQETQDFTMESLDYLNSNKSTDRTILREMSSRHVQKKHYLIVNLYNKQQQRIVEAYDPQSRSIMNVLKMHMQGFDIPKRIQQEIFIYQENIYVMIMMPLKDDRGRILGYFEGVYKVNPKTYQEMKKQLVFSLLQVVIIIFITTAAIYPIIVTLNKGLIRLTYDLSRANIGMLKVLGNAIAKRDSDTNIHNYRVTIYAVHLAEHLGLPKKDMQGLIKGSFLHDVGKIAISDTILLKPGRLTSEEFDIIKTHVTHGIDIIKNYDWLQDALSVVRCHHEQYDGTGYLESLSGEDIPLEARIFAIADVFDALTSKRPYKDAIPFQTAIQMIVGDSGKHFDPRLMEQFVSIAESMYSEVNNTQDEALEATLTEFITKYFPT
jgi:HD-GYP domain-containing protein (c-di-GMP phosphodiesterase class II)